MSRRPRLSLASWLLLSHLAVGLAAAGVLLLTGVLDRDLRWQTITALRAQAEVWALDLGAEIESDGVGLAEAAQAATPRLAAAKRRTLAGIQVVDGQARVVASAGLATDTSLADAPEVRTALSGDVGQYARPRDPVWLRDVSIAGPSRFGRMQLFVAVPIVAQGEIVGAVVVSRTQRAQVQALVQIGSPLLLRLLGIVGFAAFVAMLASFVGGRSFRRLAGATGAIAAGASRPASLASVQRSRVVEVAQVADAVDTMGQRLRRRMDGAEAFAGNAAHEFRTPIATLRGTLELLRDDASMPSVQRERFLDNGIAELARLDALVGGLLELGRARRLATDEEVDLDALLCRIGEAHGVTPQGHAGTVRGSSAALDVVASNLLDNADQHGGPNIAVVACRSHDLAGFDVIDDGAGPSTAEFEQLFERFFTTDRKHGIGLGLPVVRDLVHAHDGTIEVESAGGQTVFRVRLPLLP